ncbi:MAG: hypothetical protein ACKOE8_02045 [Opitutaceae bacterium]
MRLLRLFAANSGHGRQEAQMAQEPVSQRQQWLDFSAPFACFVVAPDFLPADFTEGADKDRRAFGASERPERTAGIEHEDREGQWCRIGDIRVICGSPSDPYFDLSSVGSAKEEA